MRFCILAWFSLFVCTALAAATPGAVVISPGSVEGTEGISEVCPTFSWSGAPRAKAYELVVYELTERGTLGESVIEHRFLGTALSWTPPLRLCLDRSKSYAWMVGTIRAPGISWSEPAFFHVSSGTTEAEFLEALRTVRGYLEATEGWKESFPSEPPESVSPPPDDGGETHKKTLQTKGAPAPQLTVSGSVQASAFIGDGTALTNVTASDVNCVSCVNGSNITDGSVGTSEVNSSQVQRRVSGSCSPGSSIRAIDSVGGVTCQPDNLSDWQRFSFDFNCADNSICFAFVGCGASMRVLGGGLELTNGDVVQRSSVVLNQTKPRSDTQWEIEASNFSGITMGYRVWATCATVN